ncbi:MAG: sensor histidine kinase, partial [Candidatus Thorarchaeota archaeon]
FYLDLMGHDIRNRLQAVLLGIGILQETHQIESPSDALDLSIQSIEACQRIISGIYATKGLVTAPIYDMNLCEALHTSIQQLNNLLTGIEVDIRVPESQCMIQANEYVYVMINNLIDNAIRHNNTEQKRLWLEIITLDNHFQLVISDNGKGIEDSFKDSIFDTDRRFGGIGVHQARRIAEKYGGVIQLKNRVPGGTSQGTKVVISFPKNTRGN